MEYEPDSDQFANVCAPEYIFSRQKDGKRKGPFYRTCIILYWLLIGIHETQIFPSQFAKEYIFSNEKVVFDYRKGHVCTIQNIAFE